MRLISKNFKYIILILLLLLVVSFRFNQVEAISFDISNFNNNTAKDYNLSNGKYKVGKEINPGFYNIVVTKDSTINDLDYQKGYTYNNYILNKRDIVTLEGEVSLTPAENIYWNMQNERGTYLIKEDGSYEFSILNANEGSSVDFIVDGKIKGEIEENNISQNIKFQKNDIVTLQVNKTTEFEVKENEA